MKKFFLVVIIIPVLSTTLCGCQLSTNPTGFAMGTFYDISLENGSVSSEEVQEILDKIDNLFSLSNQSSELSRFNNLEKNLSFTLGKETLFLYNRSLELYSQTNGAFNPFIYPLVELWGFTPPFNQFANHVIPTSSQINYLLPLCDSNNFVLVGNSLTKLNDGCKLDFGAIAKGYAVDQLRSYLLDKNKTALINVGGNLASVGKDYTIGLASPRESEFTYLLSFQLKDGYTCSTSGDYEKYFTIDGQRYCHILDKNGYPVNNEVMSVSIIHKDGLMADALSTAVMVMGLEEGLKFCKNNGISAIIVTSKKQIHTSNIDVTLKDTNYFNNEQKA